MVRETKKLGDTFYACGECGFMYKEKIWADKCEEWCSRHNSCNIVITKHAVH